MYEGILGSHKEKKYIIDHFEYKIEFSRKSPNMQKAVVVSSPTPTLYKMPCVDGSAYTDHHTVLLCLKRNNFIPCC